MSRMFAFFHDDDAVVAGDRLFDLTDLPSCEDKKIKPRETSISSSECYYEANWQIDI